LGLHAYSLLAITVVFLEEPLLATRTRFGLLSIPAHTASLEIRVLPTMSVRVLRLKIAKSLKAQAKSKRATPPSAGGGDVRLWALLPRAGTMAQTDGGGDADDAEEEAKDNKERCWIVSELTDDEAQVDYMGLESGSCVGLYSG
jgi:hypothetical protein